MRGSTAAALAPGTLLSTGTSRQPSSGLAVVGDRLLDQRLDLGALGVVLRQEADADGVAALGGQIEVDHFAQERVGQLEQDARAVARVGLGAAGAAVLEVVEHVERALDGRVAALAREAGHRADAARVVLEGRVVEARGLWSQV